MVCACARAEVARVEMREGVRAHNGGGYLRGRKKRGAQHKLIICGRLRERGAHHVTFICITSSLTGKKEKDDTALVAASFTFIGRQPPISGACRGRDAMAL